MRDNLLDDQDFRNQILELIRSIIIGDDDLKDRLVEDYKIGEPGKEIYFNPRALGENEPLYYQSFFTEPKSYQINGTNVIYPYEIDISQISYPHFTGDDSGEITKTDLEFASQIYKEFNIMGANGPAIYELYDSDNPDETQLNEKVNSIRVGTIQLSDNWKTILKEKIKNKKQFIAYDVNLIKDFLIALSSEDEEKRKIPWAAYVNDNGDRKDIIPSNLGFTVPSSGFITLENNKESWVRFLIYKNPFAIYGMPNINTSSVETITSTEGTPPKLNGAAIQILNAKDTSGALVVSAYIGAGDRDKQTVWSNYINATDAAWIDGFAAINTGEYNGTYTGVYRSAENWKKYFFDNNVKNINSLYNIRIKDEDEIKIKALTQEEYDELEEKSNKILYVIVEGE